MLGDCFVPRAETEEDELVRVDEEVLVEICLAHLLVLLRFSVGVEHPVDHPLIDLLVESSVVAVDDRVKLGCLKVGEVFIYVGSCCLGRLTILRHFYVCVELLFYHFDFNYYLRYKLYN